jgi:hypothetical protein
MRVVLAVVALAALSFGQEGAALKRTMMLLSSSTPQHRNTVKILFYGQSITKQEWWMLVAGELRRRYPNADIVAVNRSIGGFAAPVLRRTLDSNVFPFYPDLIVLHDYGSEEDYEWMIQEFRRRTTAEIALQTDHVAVGQKDEWHDRHSFEWMKALAAKYGCEWMEIRQPWKDYLAKNSMKPADLLTDNVHLNEAGNKLLAGLVLEHFRETGPPAGDPVRTVEVGKDTAWKEGRIELEFEGNRVEVVAARSAYQPYSRASFRIDGKRPSEFAETYAHTRMSDTVGPDWPLAIRVTADKPLVAEDWVLKVTESDDRSEKFRFEVRGSVTGPDGSGVSTEKFVSKSGRVVIEPRDWWAAAAWKLSKKPMPGGYEAHWKAVALNADEWVQPRLDDLTREHVTVVASGLANTKHKLEIVAGTATTPQIGWIRIYRPSLKNQ